MTRSVEQIGIWRHGGGTKLVRSSVPDESWHFWADTEDIELEFDGDTVVLVGESVARGYLLDPVYTPASLLEDLLRGARSEQQIRVVDLARTDLRLRELEILLLEVCNLQPRAVVIWAGNNWFPLEDLDERDREGLKSFIGETDPLELRFHFERLHRSRVRRFLDRVAEVFRPHGTKVIFVVPGFNSTSWRDSVDAPPAIAAAKRREWSVIRGRLRSAVAAQDANTTAILAAELRSLDLGLSSVGTLALATTLSRTQPTLARSLVDDARDAELWLKTPRCHATTRAELRDAASRHGFELVDIPELLAASEVDQAEFYLDYCHHSVAGLRVCVAAIGQALLQAAFGQELTLSLQPQLVQRASADTEARSHWLAAMHNASHGQPAEIVREHIARAVSIDPAVASTIGENLMARCRAAPELLVNGHSWDRQSARYLGARGARPTAFEPELIRCAMECVPIDTGAWVDELVNSHGLTTDAVDLLELPYVQQIGMDPSAIEGCAFRRYRQPRSDFSFVLDAPRHVQLTITCRTPHTSSGSAVLSCNGDEVAKLAGANVWQLHRVTIDSATTRRGLNTLTVEWPATDASPREIISSYVQSMVAGDTPVGVYALTGEVFQVNARVIED